MNRLLISTVLVLISFYSTAEEVECLAHPNYSDDRGFSAEIELIQNHDKLKVKIKSLNLSHGWPLEQSCDSPLNFSNVTFVGSRTREGFKFGLDNEKPFLAQCKTL